MQINPTGIQASPTRSTIENEVRTATTSKDAADATEFAPTEALARLISLVQEAPTMRPEVIAAAIKRLSSGELDTTGAAADAAKAMLDADPLGGN